MGDEVYMLIYRCKNYLFQIYRLFLVTWFVLWVILTICIRDIANTGDTANLEIVLQQYYRFFYPISLIILMVVTFYPFLEGGGRELFYVNHRFFIFEVLMTFVLLSIVLLASVLIFWNTSLSNPFQFGMKNIIIIFCFAGVCYCLLYTFKSMTVMIILSALFLILTNLNPFGLLNVLQYGITSQTNLELLFFMKEYLIIGVIGFCFGTIMNKRYCKYI